MHPFRAASRPRRIALAVAITVAMTAGLAAAPAGAIEMFTYFGDGSRIGLPSLEVPVEAYPGIPLRSDRIRARRRALLAGPGATVTVGRPGMPRGITIRAMPPEQPVQPQTPAVEAEPAVAPEPPPEPVPPPAE